MGLLTDCLGNLIRERLGIDKCSVFNYVSNIFISCSHFCACDATVNQIAGVFCVFKFICKLACAVAWASRDICAAAGAQINGSPLQESVQRKESSLRHTWPNCSL